MTGNETPSGFRANVCFIYINIFSFVPFKKSASLHLHNHVIFFICIFIYCYNFSWSVILSHNCIFLISFSDIVPSAFAFLLSYLFLLLICCVALCYPTLRSTTIWFMYKKHAQNRSFDHQPGFLEKMVKRLSSIGTENAPQKYRFW